MPELPLAAAGPGVPHLSRALRCAEWHSAIARTDRCALRTGQMSLFLASADRRVIAADLSRPSLELGADAARRFGLDQILFVETDLQMPGVRAAAFDVVYC